MYGIWKQNRGLNVEWPAEAIRSSLVRLFRVPARVVTKSDKIAVEPSKRLVTKLRFYGLLIESYDILKFWCDIFGVYFKTVAGGSNPIGGC